jgi:hypothetical protein
MQRTTSETSPAPVLSRALQGTMLALRAVPAMPRPLLPTYVRVAVHPRTGHTRSAGFSSSNRDPARQPSGHGSTHRSYDAGRVCAVPVVVGCVPHKAGGHALQVTRQVPMRPLRKAMERAPATLIAGSGKLGWGHVS